MPPPLSTPVPLRLLPGQDLRRVLEAAIADHGSTAAFVLAGIGSLGAAKLRLAGADASLDLQGDLELLTLSGSIATDGAHLHATIASADGRVLGGHLGYGCRVRTTVEVVLLLLPGWIFTRALDPATGHRELVPRRNEPQADKPPSSR